MTQMSVAGIDAGKQWLDVALAPASGTFRVPNGEGGIARLIERLRRAESVLVVLEAIGPYARALVAELVAAGFKVKQVNPRRIKAFREAQGIRAKTDRLDARLIARFALAMHEELRPLPSAEQQALKALATRRRQLVEMIAMEKTRLKQTAEPLLMASHRNAIELLSAERSIIEEELAQRLAQDQQLARKLEVLQSLPGVGPQIATTLITDLPELGTTDRRAIASLAGVAPHPSQSGSLPGRSQISGGRPCVRAALYMAGLSASRCNPKFRAEYKAMREQGKAAKVAIIAVARKLLALANAMVRADTLYDPAIHAQQSA